jgi:hypothetical protein
MALSNFFRINLPYGIQRMPKGKWTAFNREYVPVGINDSSFPAHKVDLPNSCSYEGITEKFLIDLVDDESMIHRDEDDNISRVFLYHDGTNPTNQEIEKKHLWDQYFDKLKKLSKLKRTS